MSKWRRTALEELPSCKRIIEEAEDVNQLWIVLWDEFSSGYSSKAPGTEKFEDIYQFAVRCAKADKKDPLGQGAFLFFYYMIGQFVIGNPDVLEDLPRRISAGEFEQWLCSVEHEFSAEELNRARTAFSAAKHNRK